MEKLNEHWSKEVQELTLNKLDLFSCVKNYKEPCNGIISDWENPASITISNVVVENYMPHPGDKIIAKYESIQDMIKDGWVID